MTDSPSPNKITLRAPHRESRSEEKSPKTPGRMIEKSIHKLTTKNDDGRIYSTVQYKSRKPTNQVRIPWKNSSLSDCPRVAWRMGSRAKLESNWTKEVLGNRDKNPIRKADDKRTSSTNKIKTFPRRIVTDNKHTQKGHQSVTKGSIHGMPSKERMTIHRNNWVIALCMKTTVYLKWNNDGRCTCAHPGGGSMRPISKLYKSNRGKKSQKDISSDFEIFHHKKRDPLPSTYGLQLNADKLL